jgi:ribosomal protein S27AE
MKRGVGFPAKDFKPSATAERRFSASATRCARCGGLMVPEWCIDLLDDTGGFDFTARRCVQCGELIDPVIFHNRRIGPEGIRRRRRLNPAGVS